MKWFKVLVASMGPRSNDRGSIDILGHEREMSRLQWGRDQMIAEIAPGYITGGLSLGFNGAAIK